MSDRFYLPYKAPFPTMPPDRKLVLETADDTGAWYYTVPRTTEDLLPRLSLNPGVYHLGEMTLIALNDEVVAVSMNRAVLDGERAYIRGWVTHALPAVKHMLIVDGPIGYEPLDKSPILRHLIQDAVADALRDKAEDERKRQG